MVCSQCKICSLNSFEIRNRTQQNKHFLLPTLFRNYIPLFSNPATHKEIEVLVIKRK